MSTIDTVDNISDEGGLSLGNTKILLFFLIFLMGLLPALIPLALRQQKVDLEGSLISGINAFAAGVFLSVGLVHMLFEAHETFNHYFEEKDEHAEEHSDETLTASETEVHEEHEEHAEYFPWAFVIAGAAFLLTFYLEKVLGPRLAKKGMGVHSSHGVEHSHQSKKTGGKAKVPSSSPTPSTKTTSTSSSSSSSSTNRSSSSDEELVVEESSEEGHSHGFNGSTSTLVALVLLTVLSIHALFAGIALGLQDETFGVWTIFIAIAAHKSIAAFALGAALMASDLGVLRFVIYVVIFSLTTPIGILLGVAATDSEDLDLLSGILVSFAGGSFIYVAAVELAENINKRTKHPLINSVSAMVGFVAMALFVLWEPEH